MKVRKQRISTARKAPDIVAGGVLLVAVLIVGLLTASDYGITPDEFIFDPYGRKALGWYSSGFTDRALFDYYDTFLYGPWFQILVAFVQSWHLADPFAVRHALTFAVGLLGIAALLPIGRLAIGPWVGFVAVVLCLTTGNLYGHLFFTPNDVPFLAAMSWAVLAIVLMSRRTVPSWATTIAGGLISGLAISTRFGGVLAQAYLVGAMSLCAFDLFGAKECRLKSLIAIGVRTAVALVLGWVAAIALWPWLQAPDPLAQFLDAYRYFIRSYVQFDFPAWGQTISSAALPWHYIPGQLLARLPEGFVALLVIAAVLGVVAAMRFLRQSGGRIRHDGFAGLFASAACLAQSRGLIIVATAALGPPIFVVLRGSVVFDGLRHVLFILPMLALLAAWALCRLAPLLLRMPAYAAGLAGLHVVTTVSTMIYLHPLEYVAMNGFVGGVAGAYGRFNLDYWSAAATEAVRRLEARLARDPLARFAVGAPRVMVCIGWREPLVGPMFSKPWTIATAPAAADFLIETQRWPCARKVRGTVIDRVERYGRAFATTLELPP